MEFRIGGAAEVSSARAMNTRFIYLYRDAGNSKQWGEVIFAGPPDDRSRLMRSFESGEFFIAGQIRLPERFFGGESCETHDHCFHEFDSVEPTIDLPTDSLKRSFAEFVAEVEAAARRGWQLFEPATRELLVPTGGLRGEQ